MRDSFKRGITYTFLSQLISVVLLFAAFAIAARLVSETDLGTFVLLFVAAQFLTTVSDFGMTNTIVRFLSAEKREQQEIASTAFGFSFVVGLAISVLIYFVGGLLFPAMGLGVLGELAGAVSLLFFFQYFLGRISAFLQGLHFYKRYAYVQILGPLSRLLLILLLVGFLSMGLKGLIIAAIASSLLSCLLGYMLLPWNVVPRMNGEVVKRLLSFGIPLQINALLAFVFERADIVLLGAMAGPVSVATYEVAYKLPHQVRGFVGAFISVFLPQLSEYYGRGNMGEAEVLLRKALRLASFVAAGTALMALLYNREIITLIFSSKYAGGGPVFAVLMLGVSIGLCNWLMATALIAQGRPKATLVTTIPEALVNVGLNVVLIPRLGIMGAALASAISRTLVNPIFLFLLGRKSRILAMWSYIRSYISLGICCMLAVVVEPYLFWRKGMILLVFLALVMSMKVLLWSDIETLLRLSLPSKPGAPTDVPYAPEQ